MTSKLRNIGRAIKYTLRFKHWGLDTNNPPNDRWEPGAETLDGYIVSGSGKDLFKKTKKGDLVHSWRDISTENPDDYIFLH